MKKILLILAVSFSSQITPLLAELILIDFNNYLPAPTGNWNITTPLDPGDGSYLGLSGGGSATNLIDYNTGLGTGVSIRKTTGAFNTTTGTLWGSNTVDWVQANAAKDGLVVAKTAGVLTFEIAGLTPGTNYNVELVSGLNMYIDRTPTYKIDGALASRSYNGVTNTTGPVNSASTSLTYWNMLMAYNSDDWLIWDAVSTGDGTIDFTAEITTAGNAFYFSAMKIEAASAAVPEPSQIAAMLLTGIAVGGFLFIRRRKKMPSC